jgi:hypothetical protein
MNTILRVPPSWYRTSARHPHLPFRQFMSSRYVAAAKPHNTGETDPRLTNLGRRIHDEYANIKDHYGKMPQYSTLFYRAAVIFAYSSFSFPVFPG